jgi:hypothetical protein
MAFEELERRLLGRLWNTENVLIGPEPECYCNIDIPLKSQMSNPPRAGFCSREQSQSGYKRAGFARHRRR